METRAKEVVIKGETVVLQVWDTAGVERFAVLTKSFFRNAEGVMLAFDVSSRQSFESQFHTETSFWLQQVMENAKENTKKMLIATKADLEWAVSPMEAQRLADQYSMPFLITSALTNSNVQEAFISFGELILLHRRDSHSGILLTERKTGRKRCRCNK